MGVVVPAADNIRCRAIASRITKRQNEIVQPWTIRKINGRADVDAAIVTTVTTRWLSQTDPTTRKAFLDAATLRHFIDGEMIFGFEQSQNCMWGVVSGAVRIFVAMGDQEPHLAHCAGPGFWFGEAPLITGGTRAMQALASGPVTLCSIDRSVVVNMAKWNPEIWRSVATLSIMNQLIAIGAAEDLMFKTPSKRMIATLLRLAGWRHGFQGAQPMKTVPVTQLELAETSCLSRSSAAVILKDLGEKGLVRAEYRSIAILDAARLNELTTV
jgi:CRP/FNR family transcriptional regulator, cyclic AMP receptor protein